MGELTRIQFDIDEEGVSLLDALKARTRLSSRKELFNYAITLFEWALNERAEGRRLGSYKDEEDSFREVQIPPIEAVAPKKVLQKVAAAAVARKS